VGQPLPDVPGVIRIDWIMTVGLDVNARVSQHQEYAGPTPSFTDAAEYAGDMFTSWTVNMAPLAPNDVTLTDVVVTDLSSRTAAIGENPGVSVGTGGASELPGGVAALVDNHVQRRFRGGHYRQYWPLGVQANLLDAQTWTNGFITSVNNAVAAIRADMRGSVDWSTAVGLSSVGVSYFEGFIAVLNPVTGRTRDVPKLRVGGPVIDPFVGPGVCNPRISYQTRRGLIRA